MGDWSDFWDPVTGLCAVHVELSLSQARCRERGFVALGWSDSLKPGGWDEKAQISVGWLADESQYCTMSSLVLRQILHMKSTLFLSPFFCSSYHSALGLCHFASLAFALICRSSAVKPVGAFLVSHQARLPSLPHAVHESSNYACLSATATNDHFSILMA